MSDAKGLAAWKPRFEAWKEKALPLMAEGKAKDAFGIYPWYATEGDPFAKLAKPARETRFGLVTTGGYSIEGVHEPFTGLPEFSDAAPAIHAVPLDVDASKLTIHHVGYDHRFAKEDPNANLPVDRLKEMAGRRRARLGGRRDPRADGPHPQRGAADRADPPGDRAAFSAPTASRRPCSSPRDRSAIRP